MDQLWILVGTGLIDSHFASSINGKQNQGVLGNLADLVDLVEKVSRNVATLSNCTHIPRCRE